GNLRRLTEVIARPAQACSDPIVGNAASPGQAGLFADGWKGTILSFPPTSHLLRRKYPPHETRRGGDHDSYAGRHGRPRVDAVSFPGRGRALAREAGSRA